jgi:hypothetical protein
MVMGATSIARTARRFDLFLVSVLAGGALILVGLAGGLHPLIEGPIEACIYALSPPIEFVMLYQESIYSPGAYVSWFPFGAQCTYVARATGETASSVISAWPTMALLAGALLLLVGAVGSVLTFRRVR